MEKSDVALIKIGKLIILVSIIFTVNFQRKHENVISCFMGYMKLQEAALLICHSTSSSIDQLSCFAATLVFQVVC